MGIPAWDRERIYWETATGAASASAPLLPWPFVPHAAGQYTTTHTKSRTWEAVRVGGPKLDLECGLFVSLGRAQQRAMGCRPRAARRCQSQGLCNVARGKQMWVAVPVWSGALTAGILCHLRCSVRCPCKAHPLALALVLSSSSSGAWAERPRTVLEAFILRRTVSLCMSISLMVSVR